MADDIHDEVIDFILAAAHAAAESEPDGLLALLREAVEEYDNHGPNVVCLEWLDRVRVAIDPAEDER